eukprot:scaffold42462_cov58-Phaeocystis_antarctica.AAC.1
MGGNILLKVPGWRCWTAYVALCHFRPCWVVRGLRREHTSGANDISLGRIPQGLFLVARTFWPLPPPPRRTVFGFSSSWSLCKEGTLLWPVAVPYSN